MTFGERLKEFMGYKRMNIRAFETKCGLNNGTVYRVIKNNTSLNGDSIAAIGNTWLDLDLNWLLIGIGKMLKIDPIEDVIDLEKNSTGTNLNRFGIEAQLSRADRQIELQQEMIVILKDIIKDQKTAVKVTAPNK